MFGSRDTGADDVWGAEMILGTSPRTTLIGYAGAVAMALIPVLQGERLTVRVVVMAVIVGLLGRFAKDVSDTGPGT